MKVSLCMKMNVTNMIMLLLISQSMLILVVNGKDITCEAGEGVIGSGKIFTSGLASQCSGGTNAICTPCPKNRPHTIISNQISIQSCGNKDGYGFDGIRHSGTCVLGTINSADVCRKEFEKLKGKKGYSVTKFEDQNTKMFPYGCWQGGDTVAYNSNSESTAKCNMHSKCICATDVTKRCPKNSYSDGDKYFKKCKLCPVHKPYTRSDGAHSIASCVPSLNIIECAAGEGVIGHEHLSTGNCSAPIGTLEECRKASAEIKPYLGHVGSKSTPYDNARWPHGCIYSPDNRYYMFNANEKQKEVQCSGDFQCVCKTKVCRPCQSGSYSVGGKDATCKECPMKKPYTDIDQKSEASCKTEIICKPGHGIDPKIKNDGLCIFPIKTEDKCKQEVAKMKQHNKNLVFRYAESVHFRPFGCWKSGNTVYFNSMKNTKATVCEDPSGTLNRGEIVPFALSSGGNYSRHNLYVEVTDTI
eukprot:g1085.t1